MDQSDIKIQKQKERQMDWTNKHDLLLVREILVVEPYQFKPGSRESGRAWESIAGNLRKIENPKFYVIQRSVRDRFRLLQNRFKISQQKELAASGINPEPTELDLALEDISEKIQANMESQQISDAEKKDKFEKDKMSAEEMRKQAMESLAVTQKRKGENENKGKKKARRTGNDTIQYLREKAVVDKELKKEELHIRQMEITSRIEAQNNMMKQQSEMFQQQQKVQQDQMQNTMAMFAQIQQQQNQTMLALLGRLSQNK